MGLDAPRVLMLELVERVAADTLLRATPGALKGMIMLPIIKTHNAPISVALVHSVGLLPAHCGDF